MTLNFTHCITLHKCFAFSELLLRYLRFLFHSEFPYFFNTWCTFRPNSILFQGLENQFWNSILFQYFQYLVGTLIHGKAAQRLTKGPGGGLHLRLDLACSRFGFEPEGQSDYWKCEAFLIFLRHPPPRIASEEKRVWKWTSHGLLHWSMQRVAVDWPQAKIKGFWEKRRSDQLKESFQRLFYCRSVLKEFQKSTVSNLKNM